MQNSKREIRTQAPDPVTWFVTARQLTAVPPLACHSVRLSHTFYVTLLGNGTFPAGRLFLLLALSMCCARPHDQVMEGTSTFRIAPVKKDV